MKHRPTVDITILSWDRIEDTLKAIESSLSQQNVEQHVIVIDQGSKPDALQTLQAYCQSKEKITLICNDSNKGVPGGRNQAARLGKSEFIVALDNDAEFIDPHQVEKACVQMREHAEIGALAFRILRFGSREDDKTSWPFHQPIKEWAAKPFLTDRFVGAGHMLRRDIFEQIGGYDDALFFLHEEVDLSKRIINAGYSIQYSPDIVIGHKVSAEHRVAWTSGRWIFDIRNRTYLHLKFKTFFPTAVFHTLLMVWKGCKSGMPWATFKGLFQAFGMFPLAVKAWETTPSVKTSEFAESYLENCSATKGLSLWERVVKRVSSNHSIQVNSKG